LNDQPSIYRNADLAPFKLANHILGGAGVDDSRFEQDFFVPSRHVSELAHGGVPRVLKPIPPPRLSEGSATCEQDDERNRDKRARVLIHASNVEASGARATNYASYDGSRASAALAG
jgi:hypothetical protein